MIYDNTSKSTFEVYRNKYLYKSQQNDMIEYGIGSKNWQKLTSSLGSADKIQDALVCSIFGRKRRLKFLKILVCLYLIQ